MLKKLLFAFVALSLASSAIAQHQRRVMVEEFTNASCGPCASQNPGFNALLANNADIVTPLKVQVNFPGYDPMNEQNPGEANTRRNYYSVSGVPHAVLNGAPLPNDCNGWTGSGAPACVSAAELTAAANNLTPVTMSVSHSISATYDTIFVNVSVTSDAALTGTLRLRVAVTEEEILFPTAPGSNGETEFSHVMRKMLPGADGTNTGDFAAGETKTYTFAWKIGYAYNLNELAACAWLQNDATKEVWQSALSHPIGGIPDAGLQISAANKFACQVGYAPTFNLTNGSDAPLTNANLRWRLGNGAWKNISWTGDLAPNATESVTVDTTLTEAGIYNVEVQALNSNNGIQTNLISGTSTINIKTLFGAGVSTPFTQTFQSGPVPPAGWTVNNVEISSGLEGWKLATNAGSGSSRSTRCSLFIIPQGSPIMMTPKIDLSQANGVTTLNFDHAYAYYSNTFFDSLRIEVSNDCGESWTTIFHDGKDGLSTAPPVASPDGSLGFIPTASQWASNAIDISDYNGSPELLVRFVAESGWGNNIFVDNINVTALVGVKDLHLSSFRLQPNPGREITQISFGLEKPESIRLSVFSSDGTLVQSKNLGDLPSGEHTATLDANNLPAGSYRIMLEGKEGVANAQWIVIK